MSFIMKNLGGMRMSNAQLVSFNEIQDLTLFSNTLPSLKLNEIERENIIKNIETTFSTQKPVIMIEGESATGKTTLLAQFARKHKKNCASFFIGDDYWRTNTTYFLSELCNQLVSISSDGLKNQIQKHEIEELQEHELIQLFQRLYSDICKQAKRRNTKFYIVIDGLDKLNIPSIDEGILKYIPSGTSDGVYILLSSCQGNEFAINYHPMQIQFFSRLETFSLLEKYMSSEEIDQVYEKSDGMPGYIAEVIRQLEHGKPKNEVLAHLSSSYNALIEKSWSIFCAENPDYLSVISLLTYSPEILSIQNIVEILDVTPEHLNQVIENTNFITNTNGKLNLQNSFKSFLKEKLDVYKNETMSYLIDYYEKNKNNNSRLTFLPEIYKEENSYEPLLNLVDIEYIYNTMKVTKEISTVRSNLRVLSTMAFKHKDWQSLSWSNLTESVFNEIATNPPAIESQVKSLLTLHHYEDALKIV